MDLKVNSKNYLGLNSLGRIGKLMLWNQLINRNFDGVVVNLGREVGKKPEDIIATLESDSTYGRLDNFLYGHTGRKAEFKIIDRENFLFEVDGMPVKILTKERNPKNIPWAKENVQIVVDCTGQFLDPTADTDSAKGSIRGHLAGGAKKVIASAPFKIKDSSKKMPADSIMMVYGINHMEFDPMKHHVISAASCTTTGLSHMIKPLLDNEATSNILTASMSTVHAATNTQSVLDGVPQAGTSDMRKNRSVFNNIILSTTGAAKALDAIIPQIQEIGFMADSVRIPTNTVSLITLNLTFYSGIDEKGNPVINRNTINNIYKDAAEGPQRDMVVFSDKQNVSSDLMGYKAAVVIEGHETHTRTGFIKLPIESLAKYGVQAANEINIPVTHVKIFGWYDNEFGSYVNFLTRLVNHVDASLK
ncbi:Glyceraldehyde-3-phosphate dehydrogenase [anaerobic digester metagenome]